MKNKILGLLMVGSLAGCSTTVEKHQFTLSNGKVYEVVTGKIAGDGQEGIFRDGFLDGTPVFTGLGVGSSLAASVLRGAAAAALIGAGGVGAAALLEAPYYGETTAIDVGGSESSSAATSEAYTGGTEEHKKKEEPKHWKPKEKEKGYKK